MSGRHPPSRILCIVALDDVPCLSCGRRLKDTGTITPLGRVRCARCDHLTYFIPAPAAGLAIVFTVTSDELRTATRSGLTTGQFLDLLGLSTPFSTAAILAPTPRLPARQSTP